MIVYLKKKKVYPQPENTSTEKAYNVTHNTYYGSPPKT